MDDVYQIAVDIYARAIAERMNFGGGIVSDSKELAGQAITYAANFLEAAHNASLGNLQRNLPTAESQAQRDDRP